MLILAVAYRTNTVASAATRYNTCWHVMVTVSVGEFGSIKERFQCSFRL